MTAPERIDEVEEWATGMERWAEEMTKLVYDLQLFVGAIVHAPMDPPDDYVPNASVPPTDPPAAPGRLRGPQANRSTLNNPT